MAAYVPGALRTLDSTVAPVRGHEGGGVVMGGIADEDGSRRLAVVQRGATTLRRCWRCSILRRGCLSRERSPGPAGVPPTGRMMMVWNGPVANGAARFAVHAGQRSRASRIGSRSGPLEGQEGVVEGKSSADGTEAGLMKSGPAVESVWALPRLRDEATSGHHGEVLGLFSPSGVGSAPRIWR